jgi:hypothetical protein
MFPITVSLPLEAPEATRCLDALLILQNLAQKAGVQNDAPLNVTFKDVSYQTPVDQKLACYNLIDQVINQGAYPLLSFGMGPILSPIQLSTYVQFESIKFLLLTRRPFPDDELTRALSGLQKPVAGKPKIIFGADTVTEVSEVAIHSDIAHLYPTDNKKRVKAIANGLNPLKKLTLLVSDGVTMQSARQYLSISNGEVGVGILLSDFEDAIRRNTLQAEAESITDLLKWYLTTETIVSL